MRLYRWLTRGFHDGRIIEAGEEVVCADSVVPGAHMLDVETGIPGYSPPRRTLPSLAQAIAMAGDQYPAVVTPDGAVLTFDKTSNAYLAADAEPEVTEPETIPATEPVVVPVEAPSPPAPEVPAVVPEQAPEEVPPEG